MCLRMARRARSSQTKCAGSTLKDTPRSSSAVTRGVRVLPWRRRGRAQHGYALVGLRGGSDACAAPIFYLAGRAQQLIDWDRDHRILRTLRNCIGESFGRPREAVPPVWTRSAIHACRRASSCSCAKAKRCCWRAMRIGRKGMYSTLAGFVEPGESIEQTVHREVLEEVGLRVKNVRYLGSQSWPFPNSLMLGFHADYAGGDIVCQEGEIADARWFHLFGNAGRSAGHGDIAVADRRLRRTVTRAMRPNRSA